LRILDFRFEIEDWGLRIEERGMGFVGGEEGVLDFARDTL
jgi:hypothetical protein